RYHPLSIGLIERQFGESHGRGLLLPDFELSQTCIDGILTGGTVDMATLEQWFGRDRKLLPSGLNGKRSHRTILYDYSFLARCFADLLADSSFSRRWPRQGRVRPRLLAALISRIESRASTHIKETLVAVLSPHIQSGGT